MGGFLEGVFFNINIILFIFFNIFISFLPFLFINIMDEKR